jgi:hypothetical protein
VIAALLAAIAAACGKAAQEPPGPSCAEITEHIYKLTRVEYPGHGDMAMGDRKRDVAACEARKLAPRERRCMIAAGSIVELAKCRRPQRRMATGEGEPGPAGRGLPAGAPAPGSAAPSSAAPSSAAPPSAAPSSAAPSTAAPPSAAPSSAAPAGSAR